MTSSRIRGSVPFSEIWSASRTHQHHSEVSMSRFNRLTSLSLSSYAAYLLVAACSDGATGNDNSPDPGGNTAGTAVTSIGGVLNSAGSSNTVPNSPLAGQSTGGAPAVGTGGVATGGVATGGVATSGASGMTTSGAGGVAIGG